MSGPALLLLGSRTDVAGSGDDGADTRAADLIASADTVFAGPADGDADPEATALFYTEAWRVERLDARAAVARLDAWFAGRPGGRAVLVVAGPVERAVAFTAVLDGLGHVRPDVALVRRPDAVLAPPRRSPLAR